MDENRHRITINIAGKDQNFSNIAPEEEEIMRIAAKMINTRVDEYKSRFAHLSDQDAISISSLIFVTQLIKMKRNSEINEMEGRIKDLSDNLDEYIESISR